MDIAATVMLLVIAESNCVDENCTEDEILEVNEAASCEFSTVACDMAVDWAREVSSAVVLFAGK